MRIPRISHTILLGALAVTLLMPLVATAAPRGWPFALGSGGIKPSVAIDTNGIQHYVWWNSNTNHIQYSECSGDDGSNCTDPVSLPSNGASYYPSIAIDPQGRPNVVFETKSGGSYQVFWTRKESSGWTSPAQISNEPYSELPDIAIGPKGIIHVTYQSKQGGNGYVYYAENNGGTWNPAKVLDQVQSDKPLATFADEVGPESNQESSGQLANGLYPRVAVDGNDQAHIVWNAPSPYGIHYRFQTSSGWSKIHNVAKGQKDQTPDVTVAPDGSVGIIWGTYDDFNAAFAEYHNGKKDNYINDVDGGLAESLWPRIATDCTGKFLFAFQGKSVPATSWNIYYRTYDPRTNKMTKRKTVAALGTQEQTPAIAASNIAAIVWANTSYKTIYGSVTSLTCP